MKLEDLEQLIADELERDCIEDCDKRMELGFIISLCHKLMSERIKELEQWKKEANEVHFNHSEVFKYMLRNENCKLGVSISSEALRVFKELESELKDEKTP